MKGSGLHNPSLGYATSVIDLGDSSSPTGAAPSSMATIQTMAPQPQGPVMSKKRKVERACDGCRRKKTKCDGPKMPDNICSNCLQSNRECTYIELSKPRGPPKAYVTALEDRLESMEVYLTQLYPNVDFSTELGPPVIRGSWKDDHPSKVTYSTSRGKASHGSSSRKSPDTDDPSSLPAGGPLVHPRIRPSTRGAACLTLHPWPNAHPSQPPLGMSTHLLSHYKCRRIRARLPPVKSPMADGDDGDYSSSSDVDDTVEVTLTHGMQRLTINGLETVGQPTTHRYADGMARYHGRSSLFQLIGEARKLKEMHKANAQYGSSAHERSVSQHRSPSATPPSNPLRRREYWIAPDWELRWDGLGVDFGEISANVDFPTEDLASDLFDLYFTHVHIAFPLLHRPLFERQWLSGLQYRDPWFACVCLSVFAIASRFSDDERCIDPSRLSWPFGRPPADEDSSETRWRLAGWKWMNVVFEMHRIRRSLMQPACLFEIQTFPLSAMFLIATSEFQSMSWIFVSIGLRKAQDIGAHRKKVYSSRPTVEEELWKRAWWVMVGLDRVHSTNLGRPCCAGEEDFDVEFPVEVDDEYWETGDPSTSFVQPSAKPSVVAAFNMWLHIIQISGFALRTLYAIDKSKALLSQAAPRWKEEIVMQLNTSLTEWANAVPDHLKWTETMEDETFANQSATLYLSYYMNVMLIYRPFIATSAASPSNKYPPSSALVDMSYPAFPFPALDICVNAARSAVRVIEVQTARGYSNMWCLISVAYCSAVILTMQIWNLRGQAKIKQEEREGWVAEDHPGRISADVEQEIDNLMNDIAALTDALEECAGKWEQAAEHLNCLKEPLTDAARKSASPFSQQSSVLSQGSEPHTMYNMMPASSSSLFSTSSIPNSFQCPTPDLPGPSVPSAVPSTDNSWQNYPIFQPLVFPPHPYPLYTFSPELLLPRIPTGSISQPLQPRPLPSPIVSHPELQMPDLVQSQWHQQPLRPDPIPHGFAGITDYPWQGGERPEGEAPWPAAPTPVPLPSISHIIPTVVPRMSTAESAALQSPSDIAQSAFSPGGASQQRYWDSRDSWNMPSSASQINTTSLRVQTHIRDSPEQFPSPLAMLPTLSAPGDRSAWPPFPNSGGS